MQKMVTYRIDQNITPNGVNWDRVFSASKDMPVSGLLPIIERVEKDIGSIRLPEYSAKAFLETIGTTSLNYLPHQSSVQTIKSVCKLMCGINSSGQQAHNRSDFLRPVSQTSSPQFSQGAPFVLAAFKKMQNIAYERWDFKDPLMPALVGASLTEIIAYRNVDFSEILTPKLLSIYRKVALHPQNDYRLNAVNSAKLISLYGQKEAMQIAEEFAGGMANLIDLMVKFEEFPPLLKRMLLGKWVFNNNNPYVVHNPNNWDAPALMDLEIAPKIDFSTIFD